jgi:LemA protein
MISLLVIGGIAAAAVLWFIGTFNSLVSLKALVDEAWSGIDVQLKRRYDLIPNLVATVRQYAGHEKGIFDEIAQMRAASMNASGIAQKADAEKGLTHALRSLFAVAENYPNLKANENFLSLQKELSAIEDTIQLSRRYYNGATRNYNITVKTFPSRIVASNAGFADMPYFELGSVSERENPRVQF